jgi:ABC-2 type transport system ATP-binding protein
LLARFEIPARNLGTFSGGTKVKLALALALAHAPELLILDEPTAGLDPVARHEFLDVLREQAASGEHTTLFSSHLIDDVETVCSHVGVIDGGRMLLEAPLSELSARVRRVGLPTGADVATLLASLAELSLTVLQDRHVGTERRLVLWAQDPAVFATLAERVAPAEVRCVALEDAFIALVGARTATLHASGR